MLFAHCTLMPRASISCSMAASGLLALTKMTVFTGSWLCIGVRSARLNISSSPMPSSSLVKSTGDSPADPVPATAVREQLSRMVNSPTLVPSPRLCRFLTHIVNRAIDGDFDDLKEFSIAMEVFDRTADYDPNIDAIVRVEARRLRA